MWKAVAEELMHWLALCIIWCFLIGIPVGVIWLFFGD